MDGFPTAGGQTCPSALANERIFGMLFLAGEPGLAVEGWEPGHGRVVGKPTAFFIVSIGTLPEQLAKIAIFLNLRR